MKINNENGYLLLTALIILLIVSIIATSLITTSEMENKMVVNENNSQKALLTADAGIEIVHDIIMDHFKTGNPINQLKGLEVTIGEDWITFIKDIDPNNFTSTGEISVFSVGKYKDTTSSARVTLKYNNMPNAIINTQSLRVTGRYYEEVGEIDTENKIFYLTNEPKGQLVISQGHIAYKQLVNDLNHAKYHGSNYPQDYFKELDEVYKPSYIDPTWQEIKAPRFFQSEHFLSLHQTKTDIALPIFTEKDVAGFYQLALVDKENWQIWEEDKFNFSQVTKPFNYIISHLDNSDQGLPSTARVEMDITNLFNHLQKPQVPYWRGNDKVLVIVSNDNLQIITSGKDDLDITGIPLYFLSSGDIKLGHQNLEEWEGESRQSLMIYALAGKSLSLESNINQLIINGSLQANQNVDINISVSSGVDDYEVNINGQKNNELIEKFPLDWSLLGMGKIISYKQGDRG